MRVKKFEANDMRTALKKVREELGPDAVILNSRTRNPAGLFGFLRGKVVEVTAATHVSKPRQRVDQSDTSVARPGDAFMPEAAFPVAPAPWAQAPRPNSPAPQPAASLLKKTESPLAALAKDIASITPASTAAGRVEKDAPAPVKPEQESGDGSGDLRLVRLEEDITLIKKSIEALLDRSTTTTPSTVNPELKPYFDPLVREDVLPDLAQKVAEMAARDADEGTDPEERILDEVSRRLLVSGPVSHDDSQRKIIVLVGPTGVGKTTTLAKIAATHLKDDMKIVFLTADTYRIAAVEQLQKYADIMGVEIEAAYTPGELREALDRHVEADLIFVDTAGRSPHNRSQMTEMVAYVQACLPAEVHLVLSVNVKQRDLHDAYQLFSAAPINRLLFTKLDESQSLGSILNLVDETQIPVSYVTTGQNVPEDIEVADARRLAERLLRREQVEVETEESRV